MNDSEHAALSAQLARALGWTTKLVADSVWVWTNGDPVRRFDYRSPGICLPLIEWLGKRNVTIYSDFCGRKVSIRWVNKLYEPHWTTARTLAEAVARAVIAIRSQK